MIRKLTAIVLISAFVLNFAAAAYCADNAVKKLGRGVCNLITCPFEIFNQMGKVNDNDGPAASVTYGLLRGIGMMGVRAAVGAYEVMTFPIPLPKGYQPIMKNPEFFFEDMNL